MQSGELLLLVHTSTSYVVLSFEKQETIKSHHRQLLKSELEAFGVVGYPLGCDVLHGVLQQLLVPHVGLNQVFETGRLLHPGVKLGAEGKTFNQTNTTCIHI